MIEERCVRCRQLIVAPTRAKFHRQYTDHVVEEHGKPAKAQGGVRGDA